MSNDDDEFKIWVTSMAEKTEYISLLSAQHLLPDASALQ